jgi:pyruvoyl-dependent arginine decarboxylase (PvlArgDC)
VRQQQNHDLQEWEQGGIVGCVNNKITTFENGNNVVAGIAGDSLWNGWRVLGWIEG